MTMISGSFQPSQCRFFSYPINIFPHLIRCENKASEIWRCGVLKLLCSTSTIGGCFMCPKADGD